MNIDGVYDAVFADHARHLNGECARAATEIQHCHAGGEAIEAQRFTHIPVAQTQGLSKRGANWRGMGRGRRWQATRRLTWLPTSEPAPAAIELAKILTTLTRSSYSGLCPTVRPLKTVRSDRLWRCIRRSSAILREADAQHPFGEEGAAGWTMGQHSWQEQLSFEIADADK